MRFTKLQTSRIDIRAWLAFLLGTVVCVLALSYGDMRKEPAGLLVFDASSTQPGILKVLYTKDGVLTDPVWTVSFQERNTHQLASFPLHAGQYELIGFKPLVEAGGNVTVRNLKIISSAGVRDISAENFVAINQLDIISSENGEMVIGPALGSNDPFGVFPNLQELVPKPHIALDSFLWIATGKFVLIALVLVLMYGISGNFPFVVGTSNEARPEPGLSQWIGLLAIGFIVLYLRNMHSILVPVLYTEDGVWSADIINRGFFDMLFNARADYFVFGNVLLLALAQLTNTIFFGHNLTYLPHFVSLFSMLFYAALAVAPMILLKNVLRIEARLLLWLFVLLVPLGDSSYEILGRLSNIGYVFLFVAFCLLVWRRYSLQDASRKKIVTADFMLFLCANTNPLCYPLIAVAFVAEAWQDWRSSNCSRLNTWLKKYVTFFRTKSALVLLVALLIMGFWILLRVKGAESFQDIKIVLENLPEAIIARTFLYPIIFPIYSSFNNVASGIALLVAILVIALLAKNERQERTMLASTIFVLVISIVIIIITRPILTSILDHYRTSFPDRYYFGLTLFVYLVLASTLSACFRCDKKSWRRHTGNALSGFLMALYLGNSAFLFEFSGPRLNYLPTVTFLEEVKRSYDKRSVANNDNLMRYKVDLHPEPWVAYFPMGYVAATSLGVRSIPRTIVVDKPVGQFDQKSLSYEGKVVFQKSAGRGREDGWFYVSGGMRSWILDADWLNQKNLTPADVIEISHEEFNAIPDSGESVK